MPFEQRVTLTGTALSWGCVPELDLIGLAESAARHGFPEIAVPPGQFFRARKDPDWRRKLEATGVRVGVVDALMGYLPGAPDTAQVPPALRESYSRSAEECLEAAVELGARTLNVAHFLGRTDVTVDEMVTAADALGVLAETYVPMTGRLAPGEGTAAVGEMVRRLRTTSPDLVLGVEVFTSERGNPDARVAHLAAATRAFLADQHPGNPNA